MAFKFEGKKCTPSLFSQSVVDQCIHVKFMYMPASSGTV